MTRTKTARKVARRIAGGVAMAAAATGAAQAGTITYEYGAPLAVPAFGGTDPLFPTITTEGSGAITDLDVFIEDYAHDSWRQVDFVLLLASEDGTFWERAVILRGEGVLTFDDEAVSGVDLVFDDDADAAVPVSGLVSGAYRPTDYWDYDADPNWDFTTISSDLNAFAEGLGMGRRFSLLAYDYFEGGAGSFGNWGLTVSFEDAAAVPVPGVGLALGAALLGLAGRRRAAGA